MKNIKILLVVMLAVLLVPFTTMAKDNKVNIYFFRGEGCSHCAEAEAFFKSIEGEYGQYYNLVDYETWYNEDNQELMEKVAKARGEEANGVPYIIIGDQSWNGYTSDYDEAIKTKIKEVYEQEPSKRYDIMKYVKSGKTPKKDNSGDIIALILIILVAGGVGTGIYFARKNTK